MRPKIIAALTAGILFGIILLQNTSIVTLKLLFWEISMSRIILIGLVMAVSFIFGFIIGRTSKSR